MGHRNTSTRVVTTLVLLLLFAASAAFAQVSTAQLSGRVTDPSGGVLPGVTVTATQTATGLTRSVVTNENGAYVLTDLPTGPYRLEAMLQGFRTYAQTGIVLQVAAAPVINVSLALGDLSETVTVEGAAPLVDVKSAGVSEVVNSERIVELPLQGRQVTDLIVLAGAAVQTSTPNTRSMPGGVNISVAGGLPFGVSYILDGAMHNNPQSNASLPLPFPDALQEFRVASGGLSAQNGMHSGASVNAVTKSGSNKFSGNAFEFLRDKRFNATNPFALVLPNGTRQDDGLVRNQFGGTIGGPIVQNKLFFFGAYQGTTLRQTPASTVAYVPTPAMLAGDFTAFASPACNNGRQVTLGAPFVGNTVNPALFSPAAVNLVKRLPSTTDPCGQITYSTKSDSDEAQYIGRLDYQRSANDAMFGRYMVTPINQPPAYADSDNLLTTPVPGLRDKAQSLTVGDSYVLSPNTVNSLRVATNRAEVHRYNRDYFSAKDLGINAYSYIPNQMVIAVNNAFNIGAATATKADFENSSYQVTDDLTTVKGSHQLAFGANMARWHYKQLSSSRTGGVWTFTGQATGLSLADLMVGRLFTLESGGPNSLEQNQTYLGMYAQDTWRLSSRVTLNLGLRWEPFFGQQVLDGSVSIFSLDNFKKGIKSTSFKNAPAGLIFPGDSGFPKGSSGLNDKWWNLSPRLGLAWDVHGDGRTAVRASYSLSYDFQAGEFHNINANSPPFGNRSQVTDPPGRFDNPYSATPGGDPHPIVPGPNAPFVPFGSFGVMSPDINSPRIQSWSVTYERQFGSTYAGSVSYLGSYSDRLWNQVAINPGVFMGLGPCTINGVAYTVCSTNANLNQRRVLYQINPAEAQYLGPIDEYQALGTSGYRGLKFSGQRRAGRGLSLNGNYTWSRCIGTQTPDSFNQISSGFLKPTDPNFDKGYCDQDRTHLATLTAGFETPRFDNSALRAVASDWRFSGIFSYRSGSRLNIITGLDNALTGIGAGATGTNGQRPNKVSDDFYGAKTVTAYLNRAAFAMPAAGTLGNLPRNAAVGPSYHSVDLAISRLFPLGGVRNIEARIEAFNLLNTFNWGLPNVNFNSGTFGRITTMTGNPRIMQFGVKFGF